MLTAFISLVFLLISSGRSDARSLYSSGATESAGPGTAAVTESSGLLWGPAITSTSANYFTAYSAKQGGHLYFSPHSSSSSSSDWSSLGGTTTSKPGAAGYGGTSLVSVVGSGENLWFLTQSSSSGNSWKNYPDLSCMDNNGENYDTFRDVSWSVCKQRCEEDSNCGALTYSSSGNCYLKRTCYNLVARNNGDDSAVLTRGGSDDVAVWRDFTDLSCMDNGGDNYKTYRDVASMSVCKQKCVEASKCGAVTYSSSDNCYLKESCRYLEARNNGDDSAVLVSRGSSGGSGGGGSDTSQWTQVPGGKCASAPAVAAVKGRFDILCVGTDGQPYAHQVINGSPTGKWSALGGGVKSGTAPAAAGNTDNKKTFLVVVGTDNRLWWTKSNSDGQGWGSWPGSLPLPGSPVRGSPALAYLNKKMYLFVVDTSGRPYYMTLDDNGHVKSAWTRMGNANCVSDLAATAGCPSGDSNCVTAACFGTDNQLWYIPVSSSNSFGSWTGTGLYSP